MFARFHRLTQTPVALAVVVAVGIAAPLLFSTRGFSKDLVNSAWLGYVQSANGHHLLFPSYFTNTNTDGVFDPFYAFYGGTLFALLGQMTWILGGHVVLAQDLLTVAAIAVAYSAMYVIGRRAHLSGLTAHIPPIVFVSSAYYVTDLYARGDWSEFVALSMIPAVGAGAFDRCARGHWTKSSASVFIIATVLLTGSHNITLVWGTVFLLFTLTLTVTITRRWPCTRSSFLSVIWLGGLGASINGWFLVPDVLYASKSAATLSKVAPASLVFDAWNTVLYPLRSIPHASTTAGLYVQAPVWFLAWAAVFGAVLIYRGAGTQTMRRLWCAVAIIVAAILALLMWNWIWLHMPAVLSAVQFPYRLSSYVSLATAALTGVTLTLLSGQARRTALANLGTLGLVAVTAVSVACCVWQVSTTHGPVTTRTAGRAFSLTTQPSSWYEHLQFADRSAQVVHVPRNRHVVFVPALVKDGSQFDEIVKLPRGTAPIRTNVVAGPYLATISGQVKRIGRTTDGWTVIERTHPGGAPVRVVIGTADSDGVLAGRLTSLVGLGALLAIGVTATRRGKTRRVLTSAGPTS